MESKDYLSISVSEPREKTNGTTGNNTENTDDSIPF